MHEWQRDYLCPILERLRTGKGLRILLHAPPQYGKSVIVSQRLPAYLIGHDPVHRVGLSAYNETHASNFGAVILDLMASEEYAEMFPDSVVPSDAARGQFSTRPRLAMRDAQPSFKAMGLLSGFVGRGVDTLIVDDPYKSAADAESVAVNGAVYRWWSQTAKPRVKSFTNVVVMFHRYHDDDLAAKLLAEGGWEYYRFPAIADGEGDPEEGQSKDRGIDPTKRAVGEPLSPMRTREELEAMKAADPVTFAGQMQGLPAGAAGVFFTGDIKECPIPDPSQIAMICRAWDIAATDEGGDYTAGVLIARLHDGRFVILDVILVQKGPEGVDEEIINAAKRDREIYGAGVRIRLAQDPGSAGKRDAKSLGKKLAGFDVKVERVSGSKTSRARGLAAQVNLGNVMIVKSARVVASGPYRDQTVTAALLRMFRGFPHSTAKKDGVDASSDAFTEVSMGAALETIAPEIARSPNAPGDGQEVAPVPEAVRATLFSGDPVPGARDVSKPDPDAMMRVALACYGAITQQAPFDADDGIASLLPSAWSHVRVRVVTRVEALTESGDERAAFARDEVARMDTLHMPPAQDNSETLAT